MVDMYKLKTFKPNDVLPSNKYTFKTKCKICLNLLLVAPNNVKWDLWVSDLKVFNADFVNVSGMHCFYYFFVGKFLHFEKNMRVFVSNCTILNLKKKSEKKRKLKIELKIELKTQM